MGKPLFSIITATYNVGESIEIAAASIRNQYRDDVEFIVVDGASSDNTLEVIERNRDVITKVISEKDSGIYDALNKGIAASSGRIIGIIGSDDSLVPGALDAVAMAHSSVKADIYAGRTLLTDSEGRGTLRQDDAYGVGALISGIPFGHNAMFATKRAYERIGLYDLSYKITADANWIHRAIRGGLSCHIVDRVLVHFSDAGVSSNAPTKVLDESARAIVENFPFLPKQDALDLLAGARGWKNKEVMSDIAKRYADPNLDESVAALLGAPDQMAGNYRGAKDGHGMIQSADRQTKTQKKSPRKKAVRPAVSFVIPAYNVANYIGRCLQSIVDQDFENIEVIVVDDGSTDETSLVVEKFAATDTRIKLLRQENRGQGAARAEAMRQATGDYIWCVDSDDRIRDRCLDRILNVFKAYPDIEAVLLNYAQEDEDEVAEFNVVPPDLGGRVIDPTESERVFAAVSSWTSPPWRLFVKRSLLTDNAINFEAGYFYEDHPFAFDVLTAAKLIYIDTPVSYYYLKRPGSTVRTFDRRAFDFLAIRRMMLDRYAKCGFTSTFSSMAMSYILPIDFARAHVLPELLPEFLSSAWSDSTTEEKRVAAQLGTDDEVRIASLCEQERSDEIALDGAKSGFSRLSETIAVSSTIAAYRVVGLGDGEPPYPPAGISQPYHWVIGRRLTLSLSRGDKKTPKLVLRYRNMLEHQFLTVDQNGKKIEMYPCPVSKIEDVTVLVIDLIPDDIVNVTVELAKSDYSDRELGILVERLEHVDDDLLKDVSDADLLADRWIIPEKIAYGRNTRLEAINVDVRVNPQPRTYLKVGDECHVGGTFVFERGLGEITVGNGSSIGGGCLLICTQDQGIHIGNNVMLSWDVTVIDSNSHSADANVRANDAFDWMIGESIGRIGNFKDWSSVKSAPVYIKDDAWVGFGAVIMKGVTVGRGAIVGSRSVVTKDVPDFAIVAGNPAQVVGQAPSNRVKAR